MLGRRERRGARARLLLFGNACSAPFPFGLAISLRRQLSASAAGVAAPLGVGLFHALLSLVFRLLAELGGRVQFLRHLRIGTLLLRLRLTAQSDRASALVRGGAASDHVFEKVVVVQ